MGIDLHLCDHECYRSFGIAGGHGFAYIATPISIPDNLNSVLLGFYGTGQELYHHIIYCSIKWTFFGQFFHVVRFAVVEDLIKANPALLHHWDADCPIV